MPTTRRKEGPRLPRGVRYPWREWFSGGTFTLIRGLDYHCQSHGMWSSAKKAATRMGLVVRVSVQPDQVTITVVGGK